MEVIDDEIVDSEDVGELDVERGLLASEHIVIHIDVKLGLGIGDGDYWSC